MTERRDLHDTVRALEWEDGALRVLDQRRLPGTESYLRLRSVAAVEDAIRDMAVRGAPAIGIAAAYGVVLAAGEAWKRHGADWHSHIDAALNALAMARPTAVNLRWAIARMRGLFKGIEGDPERELLDAARKIHEEDIEGNMRMGELGAELLLAPSPRPSPARGEGAKEASPARGEGEKRSPARGEETEEVARARGEGEERSPARGEGTEIGGVLTHCNAGSLATGGYGTALGVIRSVFATGRAIPVYVCETRPWLQGARLTAWELLKDRIPVTLIADGAAGSLMQSGAVQWLIVGADRIAANGDVANKIGTYSLAVLARRHGLRMMVVAPLSTIDRGTPSGAAIPIETRGEDEMRGMAGTRVAPEEARIFNPVFDVTPAELVDFLVTENGVVERPDQARISALFRTR